MKTADTAPYLVQTGERGAYYCQRDEHTLIRKPENVPRSLGKAISQRFEKRTSADGTVEVFDHVTTRSKPFADLDDNADNDNTDDDWILTGYFLQKVE